MPWPTKLNPLTHNSRSPQRTFLPPLRPVVFLRQSDLVDQFCFLLFVRGFDVERGRKGTSSPQGDVGPGRPHRPVASSVLGIDRDRPVDNSTTTNFDAQKCNFCLLLLLRDIDNAKQTGDVESSRGADAAAVLYTNMLESPQLRWAFIRKVYAIILTHPPHCRRRHGRLPDEAHVAFRGRDQAGVRHLRRPPRPPFDNYMSAAREPQEASVNFVLLGLFTVTMAFGLGFSCAFTKGSVVKRGRDFIFLGTLLARFPPADACFCYDSDLLSSGEVFLDEIWLLGSIIFAAFIVYDTNNLIKRFGYDEYIVAAVSIYLDIINLFLSLLYVFDG
ncbi:uncharacterized protein J3R85_001580 [Psidium guajava]|nr:uncharacterized protein J3R85_001580 [Psidium guajava]